MQYKRCLVDNSSSWSVTENEEPIEKGEVSYLNDEDDDSIKNSLSG